MTLFWSEIENQTAQPHQEFSGVPFPLKSFQRSLPWCAWFEGHMKSRLWFKLSTPMHRDQIPRSPEDSDYQIPPPPGTAKMSSAGVFDRYKVVPYIRIYQSRHAIFREAREPSCVKGFWEIIRLASQKDLTKGGKIISLPVSNDKDFHAHWEKPIDRTSVEFPEKPTFIPQQPLHGRGCFNL